MKKFFLFFSRLFSKQAKPSPVAGSCNSALGHVSEPIRAIITEWKTFTVKASASEFDGALIVEVLGEGRKPITFLELNHYDFLTLLNYVANGNSTPSPQDIDVMNNHRDIDDRLLTLTRRKAKELGVKIHRSRKKYSVMLKLKGKNGKLKFSFPAY